MKLSDYAYNGLNKIARKTKMDCWFSITVVNGEDVCYDLDNQTIIPMEDALAQFVDGITDPLESYGLYEQEIDAVQQLFQRLGLSINV